jgi:hypothetical protein
MILGIILPIWGIRIFKTFRNAKPKALFAIKGRKYLFWLLLLLTFYVIYACLTYAFDLFDRIFFLGIGLFFILITSSMDVLILDEGIYHGAGKVVPWVQVKDFQEHDIVVFIRSKGSSKVIPIVKFLYKINKIVVERLRSLHQKKTGTVEQPDGADRK